MDGLCCLPLPKPIDASSDLGFIPIDSMFGLMSVDRDTILGVSSLHCGLVLLKSDFQGPLCFTYVDIITFFTWNLVHHTLLCFWNGVFTFIRVFWMVLAGLKAAFTPRGVHILSIFLLMPLTYGDI